MHQLWKKAFVKENGLLFVSVSLPKMNSAFLPKTHTRSKSHFYKGTLSGCLCLEHRFYLSKLCMKFSAMLILNMHNMLLPSKLSGNSDIKGEGTMSCPAMVLPSFHQLRQPGKISASLIPNSLWKQKIPCLAQNQNEDLLGKSETAFCRHHIFLISLLLSHLAKIFADIVPKNG